FLPSQGQPSGGQFRRHSVLPTGGLADLGIRPNGNTVKPIKINGFHKDHKVRLFWVEVSTHRTDLVVTNDAIQHSTEVTQQACSFRWKIEQFHREGSKQQDWNAAN